MIHATLVRAAPNPGVSKLTPREARPPKGAANANGPAARVDISRDARSRAATASSEVKTNKKSSANSNDPTFKPILWSDMLWNRNPAGVAEVDLSGNPVADTADVSFEPAPPPVPAAEPESTEAPSAPAPWIETYTAVPPTVVETHGTDDAQEDAPPAETGGFEAKSLGQADETDETSAPTPVRINTRAIAAYAASI